MNLQKISIIIGVVAILIVVPVLMVSGGSVNENGNSEDLPDDDPIMKNIEYNQVNQGNEYVNITDYSNQTVTLEGQLTGSQAGKELVVENISRSNNTVNVKIKLVQYKDRMGATVLTGYNYELKIGNIYQNEKLNVEHNGVDKNSYNLTLSN